MASYRATIILALFFLAFGVASATAGPAEYFCTHGERDTIKGATAACYSDEGCAFLRKLDADPVRDFDVKSAPYALARGKIAGIVTSSSGLIRKIKSVGGSCRKLHAPQR